jgi:MoaA/NifB/PqqE/SkfB family radical SAM enzyme
MIYSKNPRILQLELSSMCNALCLGCQRVDDTTYNTVHPSIPKKKMIAVETLEKLVTNSAMSTVDKIEFCGTIDEPLMHPEFMDIIDVMYTANPELEITIHTNASLRTTEFWKDLAIKLSKFRKHKVLFGIDGLVDTHEIYRQQTNFDLIIRNAVHFIRAGGNAQWQFIIFPWNKHQVDEARDMSKRLGFNEFKSRNDRSGVSEEGLKEIQKIQQKNVRRKEGSDTKEYNGYKIDCMNREEDMYHVSYDSRLWPCCYFSNVQYMGPKLYNEFKQRIYGVYGEDFNLLTKHTVEEILNSDLYKNDLVESWNNPVGCGSKDKVGRCAMSCSVKALETRPIATAHKITENF